MTATDLILPPAAGVSNGIADRLGYLIRLAQAAVWQDLISTFEPYGIKPQQYGIMVVVAANQGCKQQLVAHALGMKRSNVVPLMDELVRRRLITRKVTAHDRRAHALSLTAKGQALVQTLRNVDEEHQARMRDAVGAERMPQLLDDLRQLASRRVPSTPDVDAD